MDELPVVPTPVRLLWREIRLRLMPLVMFGVLVSASVGLWSRVNTAQTLTGAGEGMRAAVTSPQPGLLCELKVRPYQLVNQGDPIAVVQPTDPRMPLDLLRAELELARMRLQPSVAEQNAMSYERVRMDFLRTKSELAIARVNLERARNDVSRNTPLYREKLVSEDIYDLSLKTHEAFDAEVTAKAEAVREMEQRLAALETLGVPQTVRADDRLQRLLDRLDATQAEAVTNSGPMTLVAPISGMVSVINRQPGEHVVEGEALVMVHSLWSDLVVGYLRQPYPLDPEIGMRVRVTTRTQRRTRLWTSISQVGAQVEVITNALAFVRQGALVDAGLPIVMELPPESRIRPGEIVDLWITPTTVRAKTSQ